MRSTEPSIGIEWSLKPGLRKGQSPEDEIVDDQECSHHACHDGQHPPVVLVSHHLMEPRGSYSWLRFVMHEAYTV